MCFLLDFVERAQARVIFEANRGAVAAAVATGVDLRDSGYSPHFIGDSSVMF
jgi:hypothetical protein